MKPFLKNTRDKKWKTLPVLMAASLSLSACPVQAETSDPGASSLPENESVSDSSPSSPNLWNLLTTDSESDSGSEGKKNRYESGWYKLNKAGDAAAPGQDDASGQTGDNSSDQAGGSSTDQTEDSSSNQTAGSSSVETESGKNEEDRISETAISSGMTQQEYEEALAKAYAAGYEDGYAAGAELDSSKLQIRYRGKGLSTDASTMFLTQGLPALRTPDAVAFCFAALDDYTGEKQLQLYRDGTVIDLFPTEESSSSGSLSGSSEEDDADGVSSSDTESSSSSSGSTDGSTDASSSGTADAETSSDSNDEDTDAASSSDVESSSSFSDSTDEDDASSSSDNEDEDVDNASSSDAESSSSSSESADENADASSSDSNDEDTDAASSSDAESSSSSSESPESSDEPESFEELAAELQGWIDAAEEADLHLSIMMLDIETGTILAYNSDEPFYSASSSKAHFIVSLANEEPEAITKYEDTIKSVTIDSDNDSYKKLQQAYSLDYYEDWLKASGVSKDVELDVGGYAFYSAEDLARLWLSDYLFFEENENGQTVGEWFESPNSSAIRPTVDEGTVTRTKAGWLVDSEKGYTTTADAGIVYDGEHPYIIAILSDYPASMEKLEKYATLLEKMHTALTESTLPADSETDPEDNTEAGS